MQSVDIGENQAGQRLDKFLRKLLPARCCPDSSRRADSPARLPRSADSAGFLSEHIRR